MTTYIEIDDAQVDIGAPVTQLLATQWRDNPLAIVEGAVAAPRVSIHAWPRLAVGDQVRGVTPAGSASPGVSPVILATFYVYQTGTFRLKATLSGGSNGGAGTRVFRLTRIREGASSEFANNVYGGIAFSEDVQHDIECLPFDTYQLSATCTFTNGAGISVSECNLCTDGGDLLLLSNPLYVRNISAAPT